jgi:5,10-methylenetetrahydromethanopterin reductase
MRPIGLVFNGPPFTTADVVNAAMAAEVAGFDSVWYAEDPYGPDPFTALAAVAGSTRRVRLGTCVISPYTRAWPIIASSFAALDEYSRGRMIIGLGVGQAWRPLIGERADASGVLHTMRSCVASIAAAVRGDDLIVGGVLPLISGRPVSLKRGFNWQPWGGMRLEREAIPIHIGTRGPRMLQLAGEVADGLLIEHSVPVQAVAGAVSVFRSAAEHHGRDPRALEASAIVLVSPSRDGSVDKSIRRFVAGRCTGLTEQDTLAWGYDTELVARIAALWSMGEEERAVELVPETMMRELFVVGTPEECLDQLVRFSEASGAMPIVMPEACDLGVALEVGSAFARTAA